MVCSDQAEAAVEITGLAKRYGRAVAVENVDLRLQRGQILALLGPNGAGKTTTIGVCTGFLRQDTGTVRVLGFDPRADNHKLRARIGIMPQGGGAYPGVRVSEMLRLIASCAADPISPDWLLEVLGLSGTRRTPYKRLSGGQQQRLSLACAVVGRPELVFLDEPTAGMDPQARRLVWELIRALQADGVSVLLTTHLIDEAETLADHVVIIDRGTVIAKGSPQELVSLHSVARQLRFRTSQDVRTELLLTVLPKECAVSTDNAGSYVVTGDISPQIVSTVTAWCAGQGVLAEDMRVSKHSLEDVFLELTGRELR